MRHSVLASISFLSAAATAHASANAACEQPAVCCEEPKPGPFAFSFPPERDIACSQNFYVYLEGLAFQAKQDDMEFAGLQSGDDALRGDLVAFDDNKHNWDYQPGMRFGLGSYLNYDAWNFNCSWTWVNVTNYKTARPVSDLIVPFWDFGLDASNTLISATSVWNASYNVLDAQLGKPYHLSRVVKCLLHAGARLAWIDQHLSQRYGWLDNTTNTSNPIIHGDNNFWGIGGRIGLDTDWIVGKGWSLFANVSGSLLTGNFLITQKNEPAKTGANLNLRRHMHQNVPNIEMAFGLAWKQHFMNNKYLVSLQAGYEFIEWFDQLNLRKFTQNYNPNDIVSRGNLTMNGFSVRLQLDI